MESALEFLNKLFTLKDSALKAPRWAKLLTHESIEKVVSQLDEILGEAIKGNERAREALNPFLLTKIFSEFLSYEKKRDLYESASQENLTLVKALLSDPLPRLKGPKIESIRIQDVRPEKTIGDPHKKRDPITLGERRSLAKSKDLKILEKMLFDPDPKVLNNLLNNPTILEKHIIKLASHRPIRGKILNTIGCHPRWGTNARIRHTLILNPYTPPYLSVVSLITADKKVLREVNQDENLHPLLREVVRTILAWKK